MSWIADAVGLALQVGVGAIILLLIWLCWRMLAELIDDNWR